MSVAELPDEHSFQADRSLLAIPATTGRKHLQYANDKRNETMRNGVLRGRKQRGCQLVAPGVAMVGVAARDAGTPMCGKQWPLNDTASVDRFFCIR